MGPAQIRRFLERPMLRATLPGAAMVIFLICLTSFAVALTLGGGPRATTVELAIYQAFRFDFDLGRAALLAGVQFALTGLAALVAFGIGRTSEFGAGMDRVVDRWDAQTPFSRSIDTIWITLSALFLLIPLAMIAANGLAGLAGASPLRWLGRAPFDRCRAHLRRPDPRPCPAARHGRYFTAPPRLLPHPRRVRIHVHRRLVAGAGRGALRPPVSHRQSRQPCLAGHRLRQSPSMTLPFAIRILVPAVADVEDRHGRLADSLGMTGATRMRWLLLPRLRRPIGFAAGLSAALSMGDLGVITLFADAEQATLPLQVFRASCRPTAWTRPPAPPSFS